MNAAQTARRHPANHAFMKGPDVYDCFVLPAKLFNTFGDSLQIGDEAQRVSDKSEGHFVTKSKENT